MKKVGRFFTNPIVISLIGLLLVSLLVWYAGPLLKFGEGNKAPLASPIARLITIMVLVLLWGLNNLRIQMRNSKSNQSLVTDLQSNNQLDATSEQAAEEIHQINERFNQALDTLKKLKFKEGGKNKALYELPWYIIVGPPGSGKTTALVNSGLDFPLADEHGKGSLQGVGGTRNCDWWFTNDAVLIDTAGRYTTQDSHRVVDSSAWEGFLDLLKRNRRRRPINGAIVAISLHDLLLQSEEERIMHAKTIRTRLDELMQKLEIRFPVYLLFTKSDLVSGFSEFFEDLGKEERDQVWGISLPNAPKPTQSPDFDFLHEGLRNLSRRLYDRVLWRMHAERDNRRSGSIQGFPQQMENLQGLVEAFVRQTFAQNRFQFQPYLRGIYFTSGTQDGTPIDRLMSSVAANFGFSRDLAQLPSQRGKSFFMTRLFRDVIFPEAGLVGVNTRYEKIFRWTQMAIYAGLALITLVVVLVWSGSVARNKLYIAEVDGYLEQFKEEENRLGQGKNTVGKVLPSLNLLAKASTVYNQESHPWLSGMGLYDDRIDIEANRAYDAKLKTLFLPSLLESLETSLRQGETHEDLYNTFRVYMMFNKLDHMEKENVRAWFEAHWAQTYRAEPNKIAEAQGHFDALFARDLHASELNGTVVSQTRAILSRIPIAQRVYSHIKANSDYSKPVDMLNFMGESVRSTFRIDERARRALMIPVLYTIQGYKNIDLSETSPLIASLTNEQWMMSDDDNKNMAYVAENPKEVSEQLKALYFADYNRIWGDVYNSLDVTTFSSMRELGDALTNMVDPVYSPMLSVLQVGKTNTQLALQVQALDNLADKVKPGGAGEQAVNYLASTVEGTAVDKRFREINSLLNESSRSAPPINTTLQKLELLKEYVQEISMAPDPAKKSFEITKARSESGSGNPITALRGYAKSTPDPIQRWLVSIADQVSRSVGQSGQQFVSSAWRTEVCTPFKQGLAGRYPFNRSSSEEVTLQDFANFFKAQGTLDAFLKENMKPFVDSRGNLVNTQNSGISSAAINEIQKAITIRNTFFRDNAASPSVSLEMRPVSMDESDARFTLDMGSQKLTYNHGPKFWNPLTWSGDSDSRRIRIIFEDLQERSQDKIYSGSWAWFRMMDDASVKATGQNSYLITFTVGGAANGNAPHKIVYEAKASSINNPFRSDLLSSFRCPESL
ncbi:MAG TPA: type VI secretion system membrane subunit TssM [Cellvibrio sp.]|nr:type VI secretion system membrane subunit TssM [Cellvibrio sp.]